MKTAALPNARPVTGHEQCADRRTVALMAADLYHATAYAQNLLAAEEKREGSRSANIAVTVCLALDIFDEVKLHLPDPPEIEERQESRQPEEPTA